MCQQSSKYFQHDGVVGEEHGDDDADDQQDVVPDRLGAVTHELGVIEANEEECGEKWKKATIEYLSHKDHRGPIN